MELASIFDVNKNLIEVLRIDEIVAVETLEDGFNGRCEKATVRLNITQNLQLLTALETAQKELDPAFQTREEILTQLTELLNKANG